MVMMFPDLHFKKSVASHVIFYTVMSKYLTRVTEGGSSLFCLLVLGYSPIQPGCHGNRSVRQLVLITSATRNQRPVHAGARLASFFLLSMRNQPMGQCCPYPGWNFPTSMPPPVDTPRGFVSG